MSIKPLGSNGPPAWPSGSVRRRVTIGPAPSSKVSDRWS
jgi:hypothetical protein